MFTLSNCSLISIDVRHIVGSNKIVNFLFVMDQRLRQPSDEKDPVGTLVRGLSDLKLPPSTDDCDSPNHDAAVNTSSSRHTEDLAGRSRPATTEDLADRSRPATDKRSPDHSDKEHDDAKEHSEPQAASSQRYRRSDADSTGISARRYADSQATASEDLYLFDPADFPEKERTDQLLQFLEQCKPSKTKRSDGIGRISVRSPSFVDTRTREGLEGLQTAWEELKDSKHVIDFNAIRTLAISNRCLFGIWMLFFKSGQKADQAWKKIAFATVNGELGTGAKITPVNDQDHQRRLYDCQHALSVYTKDFTDKEDVMEIERKLRSLGLQCGNLDFAFKPGVYSILGIYSKNKYGLKAAIYFSKWDSQFNRSVIT